MNHDPPINIVTRIHPGQERGHVVQSLVLGIDVQELTCSAKVSGHGCGDDCVGVDAHGLFWVPAVDEAEMKEPGVGGVSWSYRTTLFYCLIEPHNDWVFLQ